MNLVLVKMFAPALAPVTTTPRSGVINRWTTQIGHAANEE